MIDQLGFIAAALATLVCGFFVVRSTDLVRAVMWLALTLLGTAVLYVMLDAPFLAGVQVLTYVGGIVTLTIFGVMVTRRHEGTGPIVAGHSDWERGLLVGGGLFALLAFAIFRTDLTTVTTAVPTTEDLGRALLSEYLLAFELASLLLLGAIIGAVVIARRRDPDPATGKEPGAAPARQEVVS